MSKPKNKTTSVAAGIYISKAELEALIKAKAERDLILNFAAQKDFHSFRLDDLLKTLIKLNGIVSEGDGDA